MLLNAYEKNGLFCNVSVNGATSSDNKFAYRGDLVIIEGDIADAQGRRNPPKATVKQAVILATDEKILFLAGAIRQLELLPDLAARYADDFSPEVKLVFFIENIKDTLEVEVSGASYILVPYEDGATWTMLMDELRLEKSDFKGQSAEDKVITMAEGTADYAPRTKKVSMEEALTMTVELDTMKDGRGPV